MQTKEEKKAVKAAYRKDNPEKIKAGQAAYYKNNFEKVKVLHADYQKANAKKLKVYNSVYYKDNVDKIKARDAAYRKDNPEKVKASAAKNHAKRKCFGYTSLNNSFPNSHFHHITQEYGLNIPSELHILLPHNSFTGQGMEEINLCAMDWFCDKLKG